MYWKLFSIFAKIGAFTIGGGAAMIPLIEREVVQKNKWVDEEDFIDIISIAQSAPGLIAVNVSIFIGHKVAGIRGSIIATLGSVIPPFVIILLIATVFTSIRDNAAVEAVFKGIRPAVVSLIAAPAIRFALKGKLGTLKILFIFATIALIAFFKVSPILIIVATGIGTALYTYYITKRNK